MKIKKNPYTYSALQNVYARSGLPNAPTKTQAILDLMLSLYDKGDVYAKPNAINYNGTLILTLTLTLTYQNKNQSKQTRTNYPLK